MRGSRFEPALGSTTDDKKVRGATNGALTPPVDPCIQWGQMWTRREQQRRAMTHELTQGANAGARACCLTMSVPEAGRHYLGLSRNGSYRAAAAGIIPVVRVGRLLRVPVAAMDKLIDISSAATKEKPSSQTGQ
jgi:excisionase family DNA binding protein